jgi:DNA-binding transcriptional ArsR family regulator
MSRRSDPADLAFSALADPTRRRLVEVLARRGATRVSDLAEELPVTRQAVARHLDVLGEAGMTETEWRGRERLTALADGAFDPVRYWLEHYDRFWGERLGRLKARVEEGGDE